ncbi:MAG: response regulator [Desulfobacteraceae bacterium]|nr:response regulator [Desulfobacteraceae bacterium]
MGSEYQHKVLVVDDEKQIGKTICRLLKQIKIDPVFADSGESGLKKIKKANKPFSLIISDQKMDGMEGTTFLEYAKKITPNTIRFLITGYMEMETLIKAVNKGSIHKYIAKPWENDDLIKAIHSGIMLYELFLEEKKLVQLSKKQNTKLYDLSSELMEATKDHNKQIQELDHEIHKIDESIKDISSRDSISSNIVIKEIENNAKGVQNIDIKKLENIFSTTISELYSQFKDLSNRNGFEMPDK